MKNITINNVTVLAYTSFILLSFSCMKYAESPNNINEVHAVVTVSPGNSVNIHAYKEQTLFLCLASAGGASIDGRSTDNRGIFLSSYIPGSGCATSLGTYSLTCRYQSDIKSSSAPVFVSTGNSRITYTLVNGSYVEGNFNAVCRSGSDSVMVNGSFKGNF